MCFHAGETYITRDMNFLGRGTHITRDMCFPGSGTHITRDIPCFYFRQYKAGKCVSYVRGTHITNDMRFPGSGMNITRKMCCKNISLVVLSLFRKGAHVISSILCFLGRRTHISLGICVSVRGEHISLGFVFAR